MKKHAAKSKKPARKAKRNTAGARKTVLPGVDIDFLRQMLLQFPEGDDPSLEDMIEPFLSIGPADIEDMPSPEAMSELSEELDRLRVDANGGDAKAREALARAREMVGAAAARDEIHPSGLMILGRLFAGRT